MNREVPSLYSTVLKTIAKKPALYLTEKRIKWVLEKRSESERNGGGLGVSDDLVSYITNAGRFTDDAIPVCLLNGKKNIVLANSKVSGKYILRVVDECWDIMEVLDVSGCFQIDDHCIEIILRKCKKLKSMNIQNCRKLTGQSIQSFIDVKPLQILQLNVGGNFNVDKSSIYKFVNSYPMISQMTELHISGLQVTDDILVLIARSMPALQKLSIGYADVSEIGMGNLLKHIGPQLTELNISWLSAAAPNALMLQITPSFLVESIALQCPRLVDLDITGNRFMTVQHIVQLVEKKIYQASLNPNDAVSITDIKAKFMGSTKAQIETHFQSYPAISLSA